MLRGHTYLSLQSEKRMCQNVSKIKQVIKFMELLGENMLPNLVFRLQQSDNYRKQNFANVHLKF